MVTAVSPPASLVYDYRLEVVGLVEIRCPSPSRFDWRAELGQRCGGLLARGNVAVMQGEGLVLKCDKCHKRILLCG